MRSICRDGQGRLAGASRLLVVLGLLAAPVRATDLVETVRVTSYVTVERDVVRVLVRVPLSLLGRADFPITNNRIDLQASQRARDAALTAVRQAVVLTADGTTLQPSVVTSRLSLPSNRSFDSYQAARELLMASSADESEIYAGQGFFDVQFQSALTSPESRLILRAAFPPDALRRPVLTVRFQPLTGEPRSFVVAGDQGDIALNPSFLQAAQNFFVRGARQIIGAPVHVLFLLALMLPLRFTREALAAAAAFIGGHSVASIAMSWSLAPSETSFAPLAATLTSATVLAIALRNILITPPRIGWLFAGGSGLAHGLSLATRLMPDMQFAGPHTFAAALSFTGGIVLSEAAVLVVLAAAAPWLIRVGGDSRRAVIVISVLLGHFAWHRLAEDSATLWNSPWPSLNTAVLLQLGRLLAVMLIAIGIARTVGKWFERRPPRPEEEGLTS